MHLQNNPEIGELNTRYAVQLYITYTSTVAVILDAR